MVTIISIAPKKFLPAALNPFASLTPGAPRLKPLRSAGAASLLESAAAPPREASPPSSSAPVSTSDTPHPTPFGPGQGASALGLTRYPTTAPPALGRSAPSHPQLRCNPRVPRHPPTASGQARCCSGATLPSPTRSASLRSIPAFGRTLSTPLRRRGGYLVRWGPTSEREVPSDSPSPHLTRPRRSASRGMNSAPASRSTPRPLTRLTRGVKPPVGRWCVGRSGWNGGRCRWGVRSGCDGRAKCYAIQESES